MKFKIFDEITEEYLGTILNFVNKLMRTISFGTFDKEGNEILNEDDYYDNAVIQSPEDTINHKKGNSVDQTNLLYWLFKENGLKPEIYYCEYTNDNKISPSHMFVVFKGPNECVYWYENCWLTENGLHQFKDLFSCFNYIKDKFCPKEYADTYKVYRIKDLKEGTNPNKVLSRKIVRLQDVPSLIMLSEKEIDTDKELLPTIPNNFLTEYGYEDTIQERLTFFPSIKDALYTDTFTNLKNKVYNVYEPIYNSLVHKASIEEIPTAKITNEIWITRPTKVKKIGKIKVKNAIDNDLEYVYGPNKNLGRMKTWNYEILEGNLIKDSVSKEYNKYCVIDRNKKIYFEDSYNKCLKYIKANIDENLKCILKPTYTMMSDKDISYMFKDKGLKIVYSNDLINDCIKVSVINCANNEEIDSELCYDNSETRYVIDNFRHQYKIRKVEKLK